jgi:hypothetical protein
VDGDRVDSVKRMDRWRARAKCPSCKVSVTVYPPGDYPHRQYQLDVVADVAAAVAIGGEPAAQAAKRAKASATSARRWTDWVADLIEPIDLLAVTRTIDPDAPAGAGLGVVDAVSSRYSRAARVLTVFEELGAALVRRGVELCCRTGLGSVLEWQYRRHGDVIHLVAEPRSLSPPMVLGVVHAGR